MSVNFDVAIHGNNKRDATVLFVMLSLSLRLLFWGVSFPVSRPIPTFYADIPCYLGFYARYCAWCAVGGGGSLCG